MVPPPPVGLVMPLTRSKEMDERLVDILMVGNAVMQVFDNTTVGDTNLSATVRQPSLDTRNNLK